MENPGVVFILLLCGFSFVSADNYNLDLLGKVIYIDPGHGGIDPGAVYKDIYEADINLEISNTLASTLEKYGAIVYLTRYDNYDLSVTNSINRKRSDLSRRANIINKSLCDIYISIHLNAETSSTLFGAQVFYDDINPFGTNFDNSTNMQIPGLIGNKLSAKNQSIGQKTQKGKNPQNMGPGWNDPNPNIMGGMNMNMPINPMNNNIFFDGGNSGIGMGLNQSPYQNKNHVTVKLHGFSIFIGDL